MLATLYSGIRALAGSRWRLQARRFAGAAKRPVGSGIALAVGLKLLWCPELALAKPTFAARAEQTFLASRARFQVEKTNAVLAWQFGRACFDWAEFAREDEKRAEIAQEGIAACRQSMALDTSLAPGHYYLALNLGQLARTKSLGALKIVGEMERALKKALDLDTRFDYAGPHRALGLLYFQAPGWPASIGNRSKARLHLEKAVQISPEWPENQLCLLEAYLKWNDKKETLTQTEALKEVLPQARRTLSGEEWARSWEDWEKRWTKILTSVEPTRAPKKRL